MTYGLQIQGDSGQLLLSSESNNLVFAGKATFTSRQGITGSGFGPLYYTYSGTTLYNFPQSSIYNYTFDSGGRDCIFFVTSDYPYKNAVIAASRSGSTYTIAIGSQPAGSTGYVPTVYCFARSTSTGNSGYGMTIYKSTGETAFTTNDRILMINKIYTPSTQYSNLQNGVYSSLHYVANGGSSGSPTITYHSPIAEAGTITKPILYLPSYQTGTHYNGTQGAFYELLGAYNPSSNNLEMEWVCTFFQGFANFGEQQINARTGFAMLADGAIYD